MIDTKNAAINEILRKRLHIETVIYQNNDRLDFHDLHINSLVMALGEAYEAGRESVLNPPIVPELPTHLSVELLPNSVRVLVIAPDTSIETIIEYPGNDICMAVAFAVEAHGHPVEHVKGPDGVMHHADDCLTLGEVAETVYYDGETLK